MRSVVLHSAASATAVGNSLRCGSAKSVQVQVSGTFVATLTWQVTIDGTNWVGVEGVSITSGVSGLTATAAGVYLIPTSGAKMFRASMAWTSGTSITALASASDVEVDLFNATVVLGANSGVDIGDVDVTSIAAGETHIGQVGGEGTTIELTPTVTAGAYTAGDAVGGLLTFTGAARVSGEGGLIKSLLIVDDAGQDAELELWLFDQTFTAMADNAAWAPSEADLENLIAVISTEDSAQGWLAAGTPSAVDIEVSKRYDLAGTSLFGQLVARDTPTFAATDDVTVKIGLLQD